MKFPRFQEQNNLSDFVQGAGTRGLLFIPPLLRYIFWRDFGYDRIPVNTRHSAYISRREYQGSSLALSGWVYYHISNAMQYHNTALQTTALVMHDSNTFFYGVLHFLMALRIS